MNVLLYSNILLAPQFPPTSSEISDPLLCKKLKNPSGESKKNRNFSIMRVMKFLIQNLFKWSERFWIGSRNIFNRMKEYEFTPTFQFIAVMMIIGCISLVVRSSRWIKFFSVDFSARSRSKKIFHTTGTSMLLYVWSSGMHLKGTYENL